MLVIFRQLSLLNATTVHRVPLLFPLIHLKCRERASIVHDANTATDPTTTKYGLTTSILTIQFEVRSNTFNCIPLHAVCVILDAVFCNILFETIMRCTFQHLKLIDFWALYMSYVI